MRIWGYDQFDAKMVKPQFAEECEDQYQILLLETLKRFVVWINGLFDLETVDTSNFSLQEKHFFFVACYLKNLNA